MATQEIHAMPLAPFPVHSDDPQDIPEPVARFKCAVCPEIGEEQYPDASDYIDAMGRKLRDARVAPNGQWVCSQPCLSQLMFEQASDREKSALKRYELALTELRHSANEVEPLLRKWECHADIKPFNLEIAQFMIGAMERRRPKKREVASWIENNVAPEETLREAIGKALYDLDHKAMSEMSQVVVFNNLLASRTADNAYSKAYKQGQADSATFTSRVAATALGTLGRIINTLKAAVAGEVAE